MSPGPQHGGGGGGSSHGHGGGVTTGQEPSTMYSDGDTHIPHNWPIFRGIDTGAPSSMNSIPERTLSTSATVLDNVIPVVYGSRKVVGLCGARELDGYHVNLGFVFSFGEQDSITNIKLNGEAINTTAGYVAHSAHVGDGSTGLSSILTGIAGWTAGDTTLWKGLCHVAVQLQWVQSNMPSSITVSAELGGRLIDTTWRADGGSSSIASVNPVEIAYDIYTNVALWRGLDTTKIDDDSWEAVAAWCEEDPGDATDRWSYNGIVQWRDPDAAASEVLSHCFAIVDTKTDATLRLWADMPPTPITGDWSASGTTVTEDASGGSATTELTAGDMVYVGSYLRTVDSVTDDDTFETDSSVTETAAKVRPISGIKIGASDMITVLQGTESDIHQTPDKCTVRWTDPDEWGSREYVAEYGTPDADHYKQIEVSYSGCTNASMAARLATHKLRSMWEQPYSWSCVADGAAAELEPGDVFLVSDDVLTETPVRLLPPVGIDPSGGYVLAMREFDIGTWTNVTASPATGAPSGGGWNTGVPDAPTAAAQIFGYAGDWENNSITPGDPDDLTGAAWGDPGIAHTYNGGEDATEIYLDGTASPTNIGLIGWTVSDATWDSDYGHSRVLLTAMVKFKENSDADCSWYLGYGADRGAGIVDIWKTEIDPPTSGEWIRVWGVFDVSTNGADTGHAFGIRCEHVDTPPPSSNQETIYVKRLMVLPWESNPEFSLYERWEWTEHSNAPTSVQNYEVVTETIAGNYLTHYIIPQGADEFEFPVVYGGGGGGPIINHRRGYYDYEMIARGHNGVTADFPSESQSIEARPFAGRLDTQSDVNTSAQASGFGLSWDGSEYVHIPIARAYGTGGLTAYRNVCVPCTSMVLQGTNDPGFAQVKDDGAGSTGVFAYVFDASGEEELFFIAQVPSDYKAATDLSVRARWSPTAVAGVTLGVKWALEYTWADIDGSVFGNTSTVTATDSDTWAADECRSLTLGTITGTGYAEQSMLICRVYRDATDGADNFANDAALLSLDIRYQTEKMGMQSV